MLTLAARLTGATAQTATVAAALRYVDLRADLGPVKNRPKVVVYLNELYRLCSRTNLRFELAFAQACDECNVFRSAFWEKYCNPVGFGAEETLEDPGNINYVGGTWTPEGAARVHLVHLALYVFGETIPQALAPYRSLDFREINVKNAGFYGVATTVNGLSGRWAANPYYASQIIAHAHRAFGTAGLIDEPSPAPLEETIMPPVIIIASGHRSHGDPGDPTEKSLTPALAVEYIKQLRAAGYEVHHVQTEDGDADPDDTVGSLDTVGRVTRALCQRYNADAMLDLHYEGGGAGGVFAIVPDTGGYLGTAIANGAPADDVWANNAGDVALARAIAKGIAAHTGLAIRTGWVKEPGVMSETQTGVAGQYKARLAMFAYTAAVRQTCIRLVVEHGALDKAADRAIIFTGTFTQRAAAGAVAAIKSILPVTGSPVPQPPPDPAPVYATPGPIPARDGKDKWVEDQWWYVTRRWYTPIIEAKFYARADVKTGQTRSPYPAGKPFVGEWVINGQPHGANGDRRWIVTAYGSRVPMSSVREQVTITRK